MNYTIFDGHCDTPIELWRNQAALRENSSAISLSRAKTLGGYAQFFCVLHGMDRGRTVPHRAVSPRTGVLYESAARK